MAENDIAAVVEINRKKAKPLKKKVLLAAALYSVIFGALNFMLCWFTIMTSRMQRDLDMFLPSLLFRLTLSSAFIVLGALLCKTRTNKAITFSVTILFAFELCTGWNFFFITFLNLLGYWAFLGIPLTIFLSCAGLIISAVGLKSIFAQKQPPVLKKEVLGEEKPPPETDADAQKNNVLLSVATAENPIKKKSLLAAAVFAILAASVLLATALMGMVVGTFFYTFLSLITLLVTLLSLFLVVVAAMLIKEHSDKRLSIALIAGIGAALALEPVAAFFLLMIYGEIIVVIIMASIAAAFIIPGLILSVLALQMPVAINADILYKKCKKRSEPESFWASRAHKTNRIRIAAAVLAIAFGIIVIVCKSVQLSSIASRGDDIKAFITTHIFIALGVASVLSGVLGYIFRRQKPALIPLTVTSGLLFFLEAGLSIIFLDAIGFDGGIIAEMVLVIALSVVGLILSIIGLCLKTAPQNIYKIY